MRVEFAARRVMTLTYVTLFSEQKCGVNVHVLREFERDLKTAGLRPIPMPSAQCALA
jgi:hypothetical protein